MDRESHSTETTRALGRALAQAAPPEGGVIALLGDLGAGKTVFAQGLGQGLGLPPELLTSPTFVIANEYPTREGRRLVHADLYRLEDEGELEPAGLLEWLATGTILAVEWGDRFPEALPEDRLEVRIAAGADPDVRRLEARASGPVSRGWLEAWSRLCD